MGLTVAVTGVGGGVGQAIIRALRSAETGYSILGLDMNPLSAGLYQSDGALTVPPCDHPEYIPRLADILVSKRVDVLIPGSDPELPVLAEARGRLEETGARIFVAGPEAVGVCRNKLESARFFREREFPFVRTVPVADAAALADDVGFPLIVKPLGGSASRGTEVIFDRDALDRHLDRPGYIAQEFAMPIAWQRELAARGPSAVFPGGRLRQEEEVSIQVLLDHEGEHLGTFCSVNQLQSGTPIYVDPTWIPEAVELVERMAGALNDLDLVGPTNYQCRMTSEGPKVFEINPRFTGITAVRAAMGFNEVDVVLGRLLGGLSVEEARSKLRQPENVVSCRYVDEVLVPRGELRERAS